MTTDNKDNIPYITIGNNELGAPLGETIECPNCGAMHEVSNLDDYGNPTILNWYQCGDNTYMCGLKGRRI